MSRLNTYERVLCKITGEIFVRAQRLGYDVIDFIEKYMRCGVPAAFDKKDYLYGGCGPMYLLEEALDQFTPESASEQAQYSEDVLRWAGYYYRWWNWLNGRPSREIVEICPAKRMLDCWLYGHTVDISLFVDDMENPNRTFPIEEV